MNDYDQPGNVALDTHVADLTITQAERDVLRRLGERTMALSTRQIEAEKKLLWTRKNAFQASRPLILCDPEFSWREIIPEATLECTHTLARHWEHRLRKEIFWGEKMGDDSPFSPNVNCRAFLPSVPMSQMWLIFVVFARSLVCRVNSTVLPSEETCKSSIPRMR